MNYAGNINSVDAFEVLKSGKDSYLVDVRTQSEWTFSGTPILLPESNDIIKISWMYYPEMRLNEKFAEEISKIIPDKNAKIFFLCKVGGRSQSAAIEMTKHGYKNCYNIEGGFEGAWKTSGLPWKHPGS